MSFCWSCKKTKIPKRRNFENHPNSLSAHGWPVCCTISSHKNVPQTKVEQNGYKMALCVLYSIIQAGVSRPGLWNRTRHPDSGVIEQATVVSLHFLHGLEAKVLVEENGICVIHVNKEKSFLINKIPVNECASSTLQRKNSYSNIEAFYSQSMADFVEIGRVHVYT